MLHRVGMASSLAIAASLLSRIAAIASTTGPTVISALPARSASPTTAPAASPPPFNCAGSDDGMTETYKQAREQYCQGGGD